MIEILPMKHAHISQVYSIEFNTFSIPWTRADFENELRNKLAIYFVAIEAKEVLGYAGMWHVINEGHIVNVAVKEEKRRQGVGTLLIQKLIDIAKKKCMYGLTLEVRVSNTAGQRLYHKFGFSAEGIRKRYYSDTGEDAIIMWKYLNCDACGHEVTV
jgi:ribosomal-protein-alanine N-acetyltransferase